MAVYNGNAMKYIEARGSSYRLDVPNGNERYRETFQTLEAAQHVRDDFLLNRERSRIGMATKVTVRTAAEKLLDEISAGTYRNKQGGLYKTQVQRQYQDAINKHALPTIGDMRLSDVRRLHCQQLVDAWTLEVSASSTANRFNALRVLFRYAIEQEWVTVSPCDTVRLPSVANSKRERIVPLDAALVVLQALEADQRLQLTYAIAFFAGLRRGEIQALDWEHTDLTAPRVQIVRGFAAGIRRETVKAGAEILGWPDAQVGAYIPPKSKAAARIVPLPSVLVPYLAREDRTSGLVVGRAPNVPFTDVDLKRGMKMQRDFGIGEPVTLHEARHTYASIMIAAGVNAKSLQTYIGHSSITTTYDRYGHLFPGNEDEAMDLVNAWLAKAVD